MANDDQQPAVIARGDVLFPGREGEAEVGETFSPVRFQLETARFLAYGLFVAFTLSVGAGAAMAIFDDFEDGLKLIQILGSLTGGPLAVALGYYFGAAQKNG